MEFDRERLREAYAALHASGDTVAEVYNMTNERKNRGKVLGRRTAGLIAAAALVLALAVTALAAGGIGMLVRPGETGERFHVLYGEDGTYWSEPSLVFNFTGPSECRLVRFRPGWLPSEFNPAINIPDEAGWYYRLTAENPADDSQPYLIELYYAPQFVDGGNLILLYHRPERVVEETWGDYQILKFDAVAENPNFPEDRSRDSYRSYYLMYHQTDGYLAVLSGQDTDYATLEHIGRTLEFRQSDRVLSAASFHNYNAFMDGGKG